MFPIPDLKNKQVIFLMGPTAVGKTALAIAWAKRYPIDLISVDATMVYRGMDIGSGKPTVEARKVAPHALIDICDPATAYSAADFCEDAKIAIEQSFRKNRTPVLVGGTMMYFRALQFGLSPLPNADPSVRARLEAWLKNEGVLALYQKLQTVDPISTQTIRSTDPQRIQRALEIYETTGMPMSEFIKKNPAKPIMPYPVKVYAVLPETRVQLHTQIAKRFHQMLEKGLVKEVERFYQRGDLHLDKPSMRAIGYRQVWAYLAGNDTYETMVEKAIVATRQLAKRQMTWLKQWPEQTMIKIQSEDVSLLS